MGGGGGKKQCTPHHHHIKLVMYVQCMDSATCLRRCINALRSCNFLSDICDRLQVGGVWNLGGLAMTQNTKIWSLRCCNLYGER